MNDEINEVELRKSLLEVSKIINFLDKEEYEKISEEFLEIMEEQKDNEHKWEYDSSLKFEEQNFSEYTLALLALINLDYLLPPEKKEIMEQIHALNDLLV